MTANASLPRTPSRLDGVDALRGLAIFFVLMNHVNMMLRQAKIPYTAGLPDQLVSSLVWNGQFGVQIFFAVSGFLITSTSLRRWGALSRLSLRDFYRLRFARIAPLLILLLTVLSILHLAHLKNFVVPAKTGGLGRALLAALTFHVNVLEARRGYLPGNWDILWSLSVEEMFYLFFPLICRLLRPAVLLVAVLTIFVGLGPFGRTVWAQGNGVWKEYSYLGSMDAIALGCLTALLVSRVRFSRPGIRALTTGGTALLVKASLLLMALTLYERFWRDPLSQVRLRAREHFQRTQSVIANVAVRVETCRDERFDLLVRLTPVTEHVHGNIAVLRVGGRPQHRHNQRLVAQSVIPDGQFRRPGFGIVGQSKALGVIFGGVSLHDSILAGFVKIMLQRKGCFREPDIVGRGRVECRRLPGFARQADVNHPVLFRVAAYKGNACGFAADDLFHRFGHLPLQVV